MKIMSLKPFVPSGVDYERDRQFFVDLGFTVSWDNGDLAELQLGDAAFLLQKFHNDEMQQNLMIQIVVDDLDAWWSHVETSGVLQRYEGVRSTGPKEFPWGREIHLIDPAGVCWHFR